MIQQRTRPSARAGRRFIGLVTCAVAASIAAGSSSTEAAVSASGSASASTIPNGTYRTSFTNDQLRGPGIGPKQRRDNVGVWTLRLSDGKWRVTQSPPVPGEPPVITGTYSGSGQQIAFLHKTPAAYAGVLLTSTWSFDGKALHFKGMSGAPAPVVTVLWTRHPWVKIR